MLHCVNPFNYSLTNKFDWDIEWHYAISQPPWHFFRPFFGQQCRQKTLSIKQGSSPVCCPTKDVALAEDEHRHNWGAEL
jgi:hypothetical protein